MLYPRQIVLRLEGGMPLRRGTYSRASAAVRKKRTQFGESVAAGVPRTEWIKGANGLYEPHLLLEAARTRLVTDPENFGAWTLGNTPVLASGQADPFGSTSAYLIEDNDGASTEYIQQALTFTGDGTKAGALFIKKGVGSNRTGLDIFDSTAGVARFSITITWSGITPSVESTGGSGTVYTLESWGNGWWRVPFSVNSIIAANAHLFRIFPTADSVAEIGSTYFFGANAWNAPFPSSYQGPSLASRAADNLSLPFPHKPQQMWIYTKFEERGISLGGNFEKLCGVGSTGIGVNPRVVFERWVGTDGYAFVHATTSATVQSISAVRPSIGAVVELLGLLAANGNPQLIESIDGGAESAKAVGGPLALEPAWASPTVLDVRPAAGAFSAFRRVVVGLGAAPASIAEARDWIVARR